MFSGARIFIVPTGIGGPRVQLYKSKVVELGATVVGDEKQATHIVVSESLERDRFFKILDTVNLPTAAKIVKCTWLSECLKNSSLMQTTTHELPWKSSPSTCSDSSVSSERAKLELADCVGSACCRLGARNPHDAKKLWLFVPFTDVLVKKNAHITDQLEAMVETYQSTKDHWRALGYKKAIMQQKRHPTEITTREEARAQSNVGKRLADKIWEIVQQGRLQMLEEFQSQDNLVARNLSTKIWGAGPATAQKWVQQLGFPSQWAFQSCCEKKNVCAYSMNCFKLSWNSQCTKHDRPGAVGFSFVVPGRRARVPRESTPASALCNRHYNTACHVTSTTPPLYPVDMVAKTSFPAHLSQRGLWRASPFIPSSDKGNNNTKTNCYGTCLNYTRLHYCVTAKLTIGG
ncbi:hypothetical protein HPB51_023787 [Rhipicephalus microplus]|uniref:BRCT domain-containing protein n=1 Tax=Rhipicephalus microplus TaxID=6941 RepID=A0A9J6DDB7_RHIMP|nr:hypothetical protein HPB51_023787 [Rhipicephalus microplus]